MIASAPAHTPAALSAANPTIAERLPTAGFLMRTAPSPNPLLLRLAGLIRGALGGEARCAEGLLTTMRSAHGLSPDSLVQDAIDG